MIRFGIVGAARIARALFQTPLDGVRIDAIASRDASKAARFAGEYGLPKLYGSYQALLDDPEIDALYIPLPQHLHKEVVIEAARRGKHVLVEKPAALNAAELEEMRRACTAANVKFMEAYMYRFMRMPNRVKEIVQSGMIGRLRYINFNFCFEIFARGRTGFRLEKSCGGGALYDLGVYGIDFLRFLTEAPLELQTARIRKVQPEDIDIFTHAVFRCGNAVAAMTCGFNNDANYYTVSGELGKIYAPVGISGRMLDNEIHLHFLKDDSAGVEHFPAENPYKFEIEYFARCIERNEEPFLGWENSLANFKILDEIFATGTEI